MPDDIWAESSPAEAAPEAAPQPESSEPEPEASQTEKTDETADTTEEAATSENQSAPEQGESAKSSEDSRRPGRSAEARIKQLTAQVNALKRQMTTQGQRPAGTPIPPELQEPKRPAIDQFETLEQYNEALGKYETELRQFVVQKDRVERERESKKKAEEKEIADMVNAFNKKAEKVKAANPDFNVQEAMETVQPNQRTIELMFDSEVGPEIINYLHENPEEADRIRDLAPIKCSRELFKLEAKLMDQAKGIKKPAPAKLPTYVSGKAASTTVNKAAYDVLYS